MKLKRKAKNLGASPPSALRRSEADPMASRSGTLSSSTRRVMAMANTASLNKSKRSSPMPSALPEGGLDSIIAGSWA